MSQHRGPLLLILFAVMSVSGGYASPIHKSTIHGDFAFHSAYAIYSSTSTDNWLGGTGNWSNPADWTGGLPGIGSDVYIDTGNDLVYLDTNATIASLTLGGTTGSSELSSTGTTHYLIIAGALTVNQSGTLSLDSGDTVAAATLSVNSGTINLNGGSALQIYGDANNSGFISLGNSSGGNGLTVNGMLTNQGSLALNASDTANVGSLVNLGSIDLQNGSALQVYGDASNFGSISLGSSSGGNSLTISGALTNNGNLSIASPDYQSGQSGASMASIVNSGFIDVENGSSLGVSGDVHNSGVISIHSFNSIGSSLSVGGALTNGAGARLDLEGPAQFEGGHIVIGSLVNQGSVGISVYADVNILGDLTNSGSFSTLEGYPIDHNYVSIGGNLINSVGGSFAITRPGDLAVINGSVVNSGTIYVVGFQPWYDNEALVIMGTLTNNLGGALVLSNTSASIGGVNNSGSIVDNSGYGSGDLSMGTVNNSGSIETAFIASLSMGDVNNSGSIEVDSTVGMGMGNVNNSGSIVASSYDLSMGNINNSGSIEVLGQNAYIGSIVNRGTINLEAMVAQVDRDVYNAGQITVSGTSVLNIGGTLTNDIGGSFLLSGQATVSSAVNSGVIDLEGGSTLQVNGSISNSRQITTSYYGNGGNTMIVGGRLTNGARGIFSLDGVSDVANIGSVVNQGALYIANGATLNVTGGPHAATSTLAGYVQTAGQTTVDGNLTIAGTGMVNFAGGSVYGNGGTITGRIFSNAVINLGDSPLTVGRLTFVGSYTQGPLGSLTIDIAGLDQYDQLNITGHAQLNGLLNIDLLHGYVPQLGDTFDIMNFANESGTFSLVMGLPINGQEHFTLEYNPTNLTLDVVAGPLLSPDSGKEGLPATVPFIVEPDNDGTTLIASNIASGSAPHYGLSPTTPEPGTLLLLVSGLLCVGYSVRRRMTK